MGPPVWADQTLCRSFNRDAGWGHAVWKQKPISRICVHSVRINSLRFLKRKGQKLLATSGCWVSSREGAASGAQHWSLLLVERHLTQLVAKLALMSRSSCCWAHVWPQSLDTPFKLHCTNLRPMAEAQEHFAESFCCICQYSISSDDFYRIWWFEWILAFQRIWIVFLTIQKSSHFHAYSDIKSIHKPPPQASLPWSSNLCLSGALASPCMLPP